jgi:hypothetical protein
MSIYRHQGAQELWTKNDLETLSDVVKNAMDRAFDHAAGEVASHIVERLRAAYPEYRDDNSIIRRAFINHHREMDARWDRMPEKPYWNLNNVRWGPFDFRTRVERRVLQLLEGEDSPALEGALKKFEEWKSVHGDPMHDMGAHPLGKYIIGNMRCVKKQFEQLRPHLQILWLVIGLPSRNDNPQVFVLSRNSVPNRIQ